jgi:sugar lactone lactonase YvrE
MALTVTSKNPEMKMMKRRIMIFGLFLLFTMTAKAQLEIVTTSDDLINGITISASGRMFVCYPHLEGGNGLRIGEIMPDKSISAYPNKNWNSWQPGQPVADKIIRPNSLRIGPDGNLWIVDTGSPALGADPLPGDAAKLIVINITTNTVIRIIPLQQFARQHSFFDDLRIYNDNIFITDAGEPAIIVLSQKTGYGRRVLENHSSTVDQLPLLAEGREIRTTDGQLLRINADQLEVSPDGKWFYFQPVSGPLARIELQYLTDLSLSSSTMAAHVEHFYDSPTTGGTCIDSQGNIYLSDVNKLEIIKITPEGKSSVLVHDERLIWCDAMWLDDQGYLYLPCAQINRLPSFQNGKGTLDLPVKIYRIKTTSKPFKS